MKTNIIFIVTIMISVAIGLYVGLNNDVQTKILDARKSKIEMQLAKYKHAQEVCGRDNVEEKDKYVDGGWEPTEEYICESFRMAAMTPEEKEVIEKQQALDEQYSEYRYDGGDLSFSAWVKVTKNE